MPRGEPSAISDANGAYSFTNLPTTPFTARLLVPNPGVQLTESPNGYKIDPANPGIPPYTYSWSNGQTGSCITVPAPPAGTSVVYTVNVTDSFNQRASASGTVFGQRCTINLTKSPNPANVCNSQSVSVTYTYVVTNSGDFFDASGTLVDDAGTPGNPGDDFTVGSWGPLAPGASATLTANRTLTISAPLTNTATASGTEGNVSVSKTATATVTPHRLDRSVIGGPPLAFS